MATINIVFLLLLFFVLSGSLVDRRLLLDDPVETDTLEITKLPQPLLVLAHSKPMTLNGNVVDRSRLLEEVTHLPELFVLISKQYSANKALALMHEVRSQGTKPVLVTFNTSANTSARGEVK